MDILLAQISTNLINRETETIEARYYAEIWEARRNCGYVKPEAFWEVPNWAALLSSNFPGKTSLEVVTDVDEFVAFLHEHEFTHICFSVLDVTKEFVLEIIEKYTGSAEFIIGGYIDFEHSLFANRERVKIFRSVAAAVEYLGGIFKPSYDYGHFAGMPCIPRLFMSRGCHHHCSFCTESGLIIETAPEQIEAQVAAFSDLDYQLVYLNDKTFGQAPNHRRLPELYRTIKQVNPAFDGFIIQTSTSQFLKLSDAFIEDAHIKFVELGIESYNDEILRAHHKPSTEKLCRTAAERFYDLPAWLIPNILVGLPEETFDTYDKTLSFVITFFDVISHLNVYNLAVYDGTELKRKVGEVTDFDTNEMRIAKSFHVDEKPHKWFHENIFRLGMDLLTRPLC